MGDEYNLALLVSAVLSASAAALHVAVIVAGPAGYEFAGAGKRFVVAASAGKAFPAVITSGIALVLMVWAFYALSGAGLVQPLPLLRPALMVITVIYLVRGVAGPLLLKNTGRSDAFIWISSAICTGIGVAHLIGLVQVWHALA